MLKEKIKQLDEFHPKKTYTDQDVILLLKLIVVDGKTNVKEITSQTYLTQLQVEKHLKNKEKLCKYLTEEEYEEYLTYYYKLTNFISDQRDLKNTKDLQAKEEAKNNERLFIHKIVTDIMESRLSLDQIAEKNYTITTSIKKLLDNISLIDGMYGEGYSKLLREKLASNGYIRQSVPRNMILIEESNHIMIAKPSFIFLNEFDFKRLRTVSHFIFDNQYDLDLTAKQLELSPISVHNILSDPKNEAILKKEIYEHIKKISDVQKLMFEGSIDKRKDFCNSVVALLEKYNYNFFEVQRELQIPLNVLRYCLRQAPLTLMYSQEQISLINEFIYVNEEKKHKK